MTSTTPAKVRLAASPATAVVAVWMGWIAVRDTVYLLTEERGTVTVDDCVQKTPATYRYRNTLSNPSLTYDCTGSFVADDRSFGVAEVKFWALLPYGKGEKVSATAKTVAEEAHPTSVLRIGIPAFVAVLAVAGLVVLARRREKL